MKKNLDEVLREKCRKVDINYDFKLEDKTKFNYSFIFKFVAIFSILIILSVSVYYMNTKSKLFEADNNIDNKYNNEDNNTRNDNIELSNNDVSKNITETIQFGNGMDSLAYKIDPELIAVVRIDKLVQTTNYISKTDEYSGVPISIFNSTPIKIFRGNEFPSLTFYNWGGIISLAEYEKSLSPAQIEKRGLNLRLQEEKENSYIEFVSSINFQVPKIQVGKTYLLLLRYDKEYFDMYNATLQGIYEYDEKTNKIKDIPSGEWIDIDLNQLLK